MGEAHPDYPIDQYMSTMAPVAIAPRSPFFFHPTLVTPFEPIIPYVEIFDLNQTPVTTFDDVSTYSSPSQNISTPYSPRYVNDSNPARPVPSVSSVTDDKGKSSNQHIRSDTVHQLIRLQETLGLAMNGAAKNGATPMH